MVLALFLAGSGLDFRRFLADFWRLLAYFGYVFGCSCWGGCAPQTPPLLTWFSLFLVRSSANFAKKIQELAEDKAENPRTYRGQSREENPYEQLQENSNLQAFFFQTPFLIARVQTPKTLGGGTPPRGASIRLPSRVGVLDGHTRSSYPPSGFFFSEVLVFPLLNPPPVGSGRLHPLRRSAALARLGASWAEKIAFQEAFKN